MIPVAVRDADDVEVYRRAPVHGNVDEHRELPGENKDECQKLVPPFGVGINLSSSLVNLGKRLRCKVYLR